MKKVLFIDRDGTLINEPEDYQIDAFEKFQLLPDVISSLKKLSALGYILVMVTNQDGLGTDSFPEDDFWGPQNLLIDLLKSEGIEFADIYIDRSFEKDNLPTRKPGTGMLGKYLEGEYDLSNSFVIGDRLTDVDLAENLQAKSILYHAELKDPRASLVTSSWSEITSFLCKHERSSLVERKTNETSIRLELVLDGSGKSKINTGLKFFDHMLEQIAKHGNLDLYLDCKGDLEVDEHHTIEDVAIVLGQALKEALGNKAGIERYAFVLPMDDCLAQVALDFSGRAWLVWDVELKREKVGDFPCEMLVHFFKSFSDKAECNLNISATGENEHHKIESIFKAFAKTVKQAASRNTDQLSLPSTKGSL